MWGQSIWNRPHLCQDIQQSAPVKAKFCTVCLALTIPFILAYSEPVEEEKTMLLCPFDDTGLVGALFAKVMTTMRSRMACITLKQSFQRQTSELHSLIA